MRKIKIPFLSKSAFRNVAEELARHLIPSVHKVGAPPGTLTYTGEEPIETTIRFFQYNKDDVTAHSLSTIDEFESKKSQKHVNWVELTGFENIDLLSQVGVHFLIDQLTMEDMLNISQLPKIEEHEDYLYITLKLVNIIPEENIFYFIHYSRVIKKNVLITFSKKPSHILDTIDERLKNKQSKIRNSSLDYLSYRIIDTIVDHYYFALDWFSNILADLELELVEQPSKRHIQTILTYKKQWLILKKAFYPLKEAVRKMMNVEQKFMEGAGKHYIADLNDHLQSIGETMEILRESLNNLMDLYNSTVSNKMNEVMQVLTIVSTIFIPLTFIAGIYGMNFENMPELSWENGYFYTLVVMLIVGIGMIVFMKRKRWF